MAKTTKQWVDPMGSTVSFQQHKVASFTISGVTELADLSRNQNHDVTMELKRDNTKLNVTTFNQYKTANDKEISDIKQTLQQIATLNTKVATLTTQVNSLVTRIEALESAGGGTGEA